MLSTSDSAAQEKPNLARPEIIVPEKIAGVTTLTSEQVISMLTQERPALLIDSRIKKDRDYGHIEGSISLPDIATNCASLAGITQNKAQPLIFHGNGVQSNRSVVAIKIAHSCGYRNLFWYRGGFAEWKENGYQYNKKQP